LVALPLHTEAAAAAGVIFVGKGFTVIVLVALTAPHGPAGSLLVSVNVTEPLLLAAAVQVTAAGLAVCAVLLSQPPPDVIDHAPVVALPPTLAPVKVIAAGDADWQAANAAPAVTVAMGLTVTVTVLVNW